MPKVPVERALSPYGGTVICRRSKKRFSADQKNIRHYTSRPGVGMNTFEIYQSSRTFDSRKRVYLIWIQSKTVETLFDRNVTPLLATLTKWKAMCNRHDSCQQICQTNIQRYICLWDSAVWLLLESEVVICGTSSILWFFIWGVCPINWTSLNVVSMGFIAITNWNLYHLLCIKALNSAWLYSFNSRNYWVNT
jgi:hypothetical protein